MKERGRILGLGGCASPREPGWMSDTGGNPYTHPNGKMWLREDKVAPSVSSVVDLTPNNAISPVETLPEPAIR